MNQQSVKYELGIMMFHAFYGAEIEDYDIVNNFITLCSSLNISFEELKDGFESEVQNQSFNIEKDIFDKAVKYFKNK